MIDDFFDPKIPPTSVATSSLDDLLPKPSLWPLSPSDAHSTTGSPRGPLWQSKKLIKKEAMFAIQGLKWFKGDDEKLADFIKRHNAHLLKADKLVVLGELERQEEVNLVVTEGY